MIDYVQDMLDVWNKRGPEAAFYHGVELLQAIEAEFDRLRNQASLIDAFGAYLRDTADVELPSPNPLPRLNMAEISERPRLIVEAAVALWRRLPPGNKLIRVREVLQELDSQGIDLGVQQPLAVIGTVLAKDDGFHKVGRNVFERRQTTDDRSY